MHRRVYLTLFFIIILLITTFSLIANTNSFQDEVLCAEKAVHYESYNVTITINWDGSFTIVEAMMVNFTRGSFTYGFREIPYNDFDKLTDIEVYEVDLNGKLIKYSKGCSYCGPYTYSSAIYDRWTGSKIGIYWWFEKVNTDNGSVIKTFIVKYTAVNALDKELFSKRNYLYWYALPEEHPFIKSSKITVVIPKDFRRNDLKVNPQPDELNASQHKTVLVYYVNNVDKDETLKIYVNFPQIIEIPFSARKTIRKSVFFIFLIVLITSVVLARFTVKRYKYIERSSVVSKKRPPKNIDSSEAFMLDKLRFSPYLTIVTIFQLASKNLVMLKHADDKILIEAKKGVTHMDGLKKWERNTLQLIEERKEIELSKTNVKLLKDIAKTNFRSLEEELIKKGYYETTIRRFKIFLLLLLFGAIFGQAIPLIIVYSCLHIVELVYILPIPLTIPPVAMMLSPPREGPITEGGIKALNLAKGYVRYLEGRINNGFVRLKKSKDALERLELIFSNEIDWLLALVNPSDIAKLLNTVDRVIRKKWPDNESIKYWRPSWLYLIDIAFDLTTATVIATDINNVISKVSNVMDVINLLTTILNELNDIFIDTINMGFDSLSGGGIGGAGDIGGGGVAGFG